MKGAQAEMTNTADTSTLAGITTKTYPYIASRVVANLDTAIGQYFKAHHVPHASLMVLDYWEEYGKGRNDWSWIPDMLETLLRPSDAEGAMTLWLFAAIWIGAEWKGMNPHQVKVKRERDRILNQLFRDSLEGGAPDRNAERVGKNLLRGLDIFQSAVQQVPEANREGPLAEFSSLLESLADEATGDTRDVISAVQPTVERICGWLESQQRALEAYATSISADGAEQAKTIEGLCAQVESLRGDLTAAHAHIDELLTRPSLPAKKSETADRVIKTHQIEIARLQDKLREVEAVVSEQVPHFNDAALTLLISELPVLLFEIEEGKTELATAKRRLDELVSDQSRATERLMETIGDERDITQVQTAIGKINSTILSASTECQRGRSRVASLESRRSRVIESISRRASELYAEVLSRQVVIGGERSTLPLPSGDQTSLLWGMIDAFPSPNLFLETTHYPLMNKFAYYHRRGQGVLSSLSVFLQQIASGEIVQMMDRAQREKRLQKRGREGLETLIEDVKTLPFFLPDGTIDYSILARHYEEKLREAESNSYIARRIPNVNIPEPSISTLEIATLVSRVNEHPELFLHVRNHIETFHAFARRGFFETIWELLGMIPNKAFRAKAWQLYQEGGCKKYLAEWAGYLTAHLERLDIWTSDQSKPDAAKIAALLP